MSATTALLVALGAAVGAPARYLVDRAIQSRLGTAVPWGTFAVNVVASVVLGVVLGSGATPAVTAAVGVGFCGGLSTWSTLAYETVRLGEQRAWWTAVLNVVGSTVACLGAVWASHM